MGRVRCTWMMAFVFVATCAGCANSRIVFDQPAATDPDRVGLGFFSHSAAGARRDYLHADDIVVRRTCAVRDIEWWGLVDGSPADGLENIASFSIAIYVARANDELEPPARGPGELIGEWTFPVDETNPKETGRFGSGRDGAGTSPEFRHSVTLEEPIRLRQRDTYYIAISAELIDPQGCNWQWQDGALNNGTSFSYFWKHGRWTRIEDTDSAVRLLRD